MIWREGSRFLGAFVAFSCLGMLFAIGGLHGLFLTTTTFILFCLPGILVGTRLFGPVSWKRPEGWILGSVFGLVSSEFVVLMSSYVLGWKISKLLAALAIFYIISVALTRFTLKRRIILTSPEWALRDYSILFAAILAFLIFAALPFFNFGRLTSSGYAYSWLFGFDFILRGSYAASITLGMPPDFLHLTGNTFRYYLVSYTAPAFAYSLGNKNTPVMYLLLSYTLITDLLFIVSLFIVLRHFVRNYRALGWTAFIAMAAYSYYSFYSFVHLALLNLPQSGGIFGKNHILFSYFSYNDVSHLFQRPMLVEPQAITGLCVLLCIIYVLEVLCYALTRYDLAFVLGLGLGIIFGIDALLGLITMIWVGTLYFVRWFRDGRTLVSELGPVCFSTLVCASVYLSYFAVGMYRASDSGQLYVRTYWWIIRYAPVYFPLEFGPMFILGMWGLWRFRKRNHPQLSVSLTLFAVVVLAQVVFLGVGVLPRERLADRILPIVFLVWTGLFLEDVFTIERNRWIRIAAVLLIFAAVPTYFTDIYFTSAIHDPNRTSYVTPADMRACEWMRRNVPEAAIVQSEPNYFGKFSVVGPQLVYPISLIPDFAERRVIVGEWYVAGTLLAQSKQIEEVRAHDIRDMFSARDIREVLRVVSKYSIDYLYIGPLEQNKYPQILGVLQSQPTFFHEVYSRQGVHILARSPQSVVP
jgi:hypothetical protein